jgi:hypothetical protein
MNLLILHKRNFAARLAVLWFALGAHSAISSPRAAATTLIHMTVAQMAKVAQVIVRARCIASSTSWDAGEIWTFTDFEVQETWSGSATSRIAVRLLGGKLGNVTSTVSGVPSFHAGEDVILFLERTRAGDFSIVSWQQGTFRIHRDRFSGEETITQDSASFPAFDPGSRQFETSGIRNLPMNSFRGQVDTALRYGGRSR